MAARARFHVQKKTAHALEQDRPDVLKRREDWFDGQLELDPKRLVFIDETGLSTKMARLHADGYAGFNGLFGENKAQEMACMAHVRRKFVDAQTSHGSSIAVEAIQRIAGLYEIEKKARGKPPPERTA